MLPICFFKKPYKDEHVLVLEKPTYSEAEVCEDLEINVFL